jgi:hypothetical protein
MQRIVPILVALMLGMVCPAQVPAVQATVGSYFLPPPGHTHVPATNGSFGAYLRSLPLKAEGTPVRTYSGALKGRQDVHAAVLDISTGDRDLQQCADAVMRLRAEYLYGSGQQDRIIFHLTNGFAAEWSRWRSGERIRVNGNVCQWYKGAKPDSSHDELLRYLTTVFTYAGTLSLEKELAPVSGSPILPGDVFIHGGSPGHAVIVLDVATDASGRAAYLLAQSYMPAQDIHVLRVPGKPNEQAWYTTAPGERLVTPEWTFGPNERRRFREF